MRQCREMEKWGRNKIVFQSEWTLAYLDLYGGDCGLNHSCFLRSSVQFL